MKATRVLVVDDHPAVREGIRRLLEMDDGILVLGEAGSAEEALDQMSARPAGVVLMDMKLPGMDGIEATRQLKLAHPEAKVVILSAFGSEYMAQAIEAGANGYILKSATQNELTDAVHQAAMGQSPIDPKLTPGLLDRFANLSRMAQHHGLTSRQHEILRLVASGVPSKEIAAQLAVSDATFKREIKAIFNYMGVNDRAHAIAEGYRRQLL